MRFGFVILHYLTENDTIECVSSIEEKCKNQDYSIVIVDNYSNNGSIEKVENLLREKNNVYILKNKKNLGFARGNNIGYKYCKETLKCDNIIISNNDIIVDSENIFDVVKEDVEKYNCAIIGPDIESLTDYQHQNPMKEENLEKKSVIKNIVKYSILYILCICKLYSIVQRIFGLKKKRIDEIKNHFIPEKKENIQLHGAFLIFTKKFVEKMDKAFCDETFLYMEEVILKIICDKNDLKTLYDPSIKVYHKEDSSTNKLHNKNNEKRKFVFRNMIKSNKVLMKYL